MTHYLSRIVTDPEICGGRPTIKGTRMRVSDVVDLVAVGETREVILADYPYLEDEDITAALQYAAAAESQSLETLSTLQSQKKMLNLIGSLEWESDYDYKVSRSRS